MFLGRRRHSSLFAIVVSTTVEPQYVFGAATFSLRRHTEIKSGHAASGQPRRDEESGKKGKKSAPRGCVSLNNWGPSKELFLRRDRYVGVPAGVWTNA
jgi:hypothetical protein